MHAVVTRAECCEGWDDLDPGPGLRCEPRCHAGCDRGWCHAPGQCLCHTGYMGPRCELEIETTTSVDTTSSTRITTTTTSTSTSTTTEIPTTTSDTTTETTDLTAGIEQNSDDVENYRESKVMNRTNEIMMTADKFEMRTTELGDMTPILGGDLMIVILSVFAFLFLVSIILTAVYFR